MTAERLGQLRDQQKQAWDMVHASRYRELAPLVASLIPELEQAVRASAAPELTEAVRELLTDTYQAVAAMMAKLGETDAAWIAADRAAFAAEMLHDRLAVAASLFRMADVFLTCARPARPRLSPALLSAAWNNRPPGRRQPEPCRYAGLFTWCWPSQQRAKLPRRSRAAHPRADADAPGRASSRP